MTLNTSIFVDMVASLYNMNVLQHMECTQRETKGPNVTRSSICLLVIVEK